MGETGGGGSGKGVGVTLGHGLGMGQWWGVGETIWQGGVGGWARGLGGFGGGGKGGREVHLHNLVLEKRCFPSVFGGAEGLLRWDPFLGKTTSVHES